MQEKTPIIYILCGLTNADSEEFKTEIAKVAKENGYEAVCVSRYRKEGIRQYIREHSEFRTLVLQESMQPNYPYTADELSELMDNFHLNIVISLRKVHRGSPYMKTLYTAGILNALYEEDATAQNVFNKILYPRTRGECRKYYQIQNARDAERALDIVDEERMKQYVSYIEEAGNQDEIIRRYHYIASEMKMVENIYLTNELSSYVKNMLEGNEIYEKVMGVSAKKGRFGCLYCRGKVSAIFNPIKKVNKTDEERLPVLMEVPAVKEHKKTGVEKMLDEDISDLLGFATTKKEEGEEVCGIAEKIEESVVVPNNEIELEAIKRVPRWIIGLLGLMATIVVLAIFILVL